VSLALACLQHRNPEALALFNTLISLSHTMSLATFFVYSLCFGGAALARHLATNNGALLPSWVILSAAVDYKSLRSLLYSQAHKLSKTARLSLEYVDSVSHIMNTSILRHASLRY
jgi:hypothetical protein